MAHHKKRYERLVGLFCIGSMLFSPPILALFNSGRFRAGFPGLYLFIFVSWLLFIGGIFLIIRERNRPPSKRS